MELVQNVCCPVCGCLCDDIEASVDNNRIVKVANACTVSASKFLNYYKERNLSPLMRKNSELQKTSLQEAIRKIAEMLVNAEYPILYGWSLTSCEAQKVGLELTEEVGGLMENQTVVCHGPSALGVQEVGDPTCTLGEVRHRADLIIYWGCNPEESHPRHIRRYSAMSQGKFRKKREERKLVVVDVRRTPAARLADLFIEVEPNQDYELLSAIRMTVQNEEIEQEKVGGVPVDQIEDLADLMVNCEFGVLFYGLGLTHSMGKERNIDVAISLVRDLNSKTKFSIMPMRGHFNVTGANKVCTWQTGYPYAVDFRRGYPLYSPGDTTVIDILRRGESDAALIVSSDPVAHFPRKAAENLCANPLAVIDPHMSLTALGADVVIPSAFIGIEAEGSAYRMDGVPLLMRKVVEPPEGIQGDVELLHLILQEVRSLKR